MTTKEKTLLTLTLAVAAVVLAAVVGYDYKTRQGRPTPQQTQTQQQPRDETANWKTYRNQFYGFELQYPKNWIYDDASIYAGPFPVAPDPSSRTGVQLGSLRNYQEEEAYGCTVSGNACIRISIYPNKLNGETIENWVTRQEFNLNLIYSEDRVRELIDFVNKEIGPFTREDVISDLEKSKIGGKEAMIHIFGCKKPCYVEGGPSTSKGVYLSLNDWAVLGLSIQSGTYGHERLFEVFDQILPTFKFTK